MSLATLTRTGRAAMVKAMLSQPLHLAWGTGLAEWDAEDAELPSLINSTALYAELGRRIPAAVGYVIPDDEGEITIPVGRGGEEVEEVRYNRSTEPTPYLYIRINYDYADASSAIIRELGVFMGTQTDPDLPEGQRYFTPAEIIDPGLLLAAQIITPPITRSPSVRQSIEFVLAI